MDVKETNEKFRAKLGKNYEEYISKLNNLSLSEIIEKAEEISAVKKLYEILSERGFSTSDINYMLDNFQNPLDIICREWLIYHSDLPYDGVQYVLWNIHDKQKYQSDFSD